MPISVADDDDITSVEAPAPWWRRNTMLGSPLGRITEKRRSQYSIQLRDSTVSITLPPDTDEPSWLLPSLQALCELGSLSEDWNSYGALSVAIDAVAATLQLLTLIMTEATPLPLFVPTRRGGIQLEWHMRGIDLEIDTLPTGRIFATFEDHRTQEEWEAEVTSDLQIVKRVLRQLSGP
jgi:hypothetical protein